jgi:hypothetical protein
MTINSEVSRVRYVGNGVTTVFAVNFSYLTSNDGTAQIAVYAGDNNTPLVEGVDYTVNGFGRYDDYSEQVEEGLITYETRYDSGEVVFKVAPEDKTPVAIIRSVPQTQGVVFVEGEKFPAKDFENALDKLTMEVQEVKENLQRAVMFPPTSNIDPFQARDEILKDANRASEAAENAKKSEDIATAAMDAALGAAEEAIASEIAAKTSEEASAASAEESKQYSEQSKAYSDLSGEYKDYVEYVFQSLNNTIVVKGRVDTPDELPLENNKGGDMYLVGGLDEADKNEYVWIAEENRWENLGKAVEIEIASEDTQGITKIYNSVNDQTDGGITPNAVSTALANIYTKDEVFTKEEVTQAIESATPEMSADKVEYNNGSITTVQQALDQLLYVAPSITSFSGGGTYEVGQSIASVNLAWALNKAVTSQSINQGIGSLDVGLRSYTHTPSTPIRSNVTYTLTVSDGKNSASKSTSLAFRYKRYWGVSTSDTLDNAGVLALSKELTTGRTQSRTFNCSGGKYFYFVIPAEYCNGISFKVGGLAFSDMDVKDMAVVNESGATVNCKVYRSKNIQTGSAINVEVL